MSFADLYNRGDGGTLIRRGSRQLSQQQQRPSSATQYQHGFGDSSATGTTSLSSSTVLVEHGERPSWAIGYHDKLHFAKSIADSVQPTQRASASASAALSAPGKPAARPSSDSQAPESIDQTVLKSYIVLPPATASTPPETVRGTLASPATAASGKLIMQIKSVEAGIVIAIAKLQSHCSTITKLQRETSAASLDAYKELATEREEAVNTFNHIRSLFFELSQLQQSIPAEQQQWVEDRFRDLFIDYGCVVQDFEQLCFPHHDGDSGNDSGNDSESTPLFNSPSTAEDEVFKLSGKSPEEISRLLVQRRNEQMARREQRRSEIEHQLYVLAQETEFAQNEQEQIQRIKMQERLERELLELNSMFQDLAHMVQKSADLVNRLEEQVEETRSRVVSGTKELGKAAKIQAVLYPLLFGVAGGVIAGPIGFFAGLKGGGLVGAAAIGAGVGAGAGVGIKSLKGLYAEKQLEKVTKPTQQAVVDDMADVLGDSSSNHPPIIVRDKRT